MKTKIVLALATAALSICLITGCGTSSNNAPESTKAVTEVSTTTEKPTTTEAPATTPEATTPKTPTATPEATTTSEPITTEKPTTPEPTTTEIPTAIPEVTTAEIPTTPSEPTTTPEPATTPEQPQQTVNTAFNSYAEARAYAISLGYPIGQAVDNGNGTAYCYCIGHPDSPIYGEDSALHSADIDSARRCADDIFGFGTNYQSVTENDGTHVERLGNGWTVYRFTYIPTYPKVPTSDYTDFPYELYTLYDNGTYFYFYTLENDGINKPGYWYDIINTCEIANAHRFATYDEWGAVRPASEWADSGYMLKGEKVMIEARFSTKEQLQNRGLWTE